MLCYTRHLIHSCFLGHRTFQNTKQNTTSHHRAPNFVPWQPTSSFLTLFCCYICHLWTFPKCMQVPRCGRSLNSSIHPSTCQVKRPRILNPSPQMLRSRKLIAQYLLQNRSRGLDQRRPDVSRIW